MFIIFLILFDEFIHTCGNTLTTVQKDAVDRSINGHVRTAMAHSQTTSKGLNMFSMHYNHCFIRCFKSYTQIAS